MPIKTESNTIKAEIVLDNRTTHSYSIIDHYINNYNNPQVKIINVITGGQAPQRFITRWNEVVDLKNEIIAITD